MDINLFRKALANKQNLLTEDAKMERAANRALDNTNKELDRVEIALDRAIDQLENYLYYSNLAKSIDPEEARKIGEALKEFKALLKQINKSGQKIPLA